MAEGRRDAELIEDHLSRGDRARRRADFSVGDNAAELPGEETSSRGVPLSGGLPTHPQRGLQKDPPL